MGVQRKQSLNSGIPLQTLQENVKRACVDGGVTKCSAGWPTILTDYLERAVGNLIFMSNKLFSLSSKIVKEPAFSYCEIIGIEHRSNDSEKTFWSNHFFFHTLLCLYNRPPVLLAWNWLRCRRLTLIIHQFQNRHFKTLLVHTTMSDARSRQNYDKTLSAVRPTERTNFDQLVILTKGKAMYGMQKSLQVHPSKANWWQKRLQSRKFNDRPERWEGDQDKEAWFCSSGSSCERQWQVQAQAYIESQNC